MSTGLIRLRDIRMWITLIGVRLVNPCCAFSCVLTFETSLESCIYLRLDSHTLQLQDSAGVAGQESGLGHGSQAPLQEVVHRLPQGDIGVGGASAAS